VVIVLIRKRLYREFPVFSIYLVWVLAAALAATLAASRLQPDLYNHLYFISSVFDAILMFSVLVEMTMSVLKPVRDMLPRWTVFAVAGLIGLISIPVWHVATPPGIAAVSKISQYIIRFDISSSMLRIIFFVSLAALSQLLSLGWRDRVVQISTGLGFFSLVSLGVTFLHMNLGVGGQHQNDLYHVLDRLVVFAYISSMLYWLVSFWRDVPERKEFTPQMQTFISSLAQSTRSVRLAMSNPDPKN
jgi:hypothetical protein